MKLEIVSRICLARHLYELGMSSLRGTNDLQLFATVNLFQDAVEAFLLAVGEHVGAAIEPKTEFDKYFVYINQKISPNELPFKPKMIQLNKLRVNSKHYALQPSRNECERLALSVREFFDEVSNTVLGVNFSTVSAIDLLDDGDVKELLEEAKNALAAREYADCLISCRKAVYLEVEINYSIAPFSRRNELAMYGCKAPFFARNKEYIDKNVNDPTDFIVLDHTRVEQELLSTGVDTTQFWNLYRLTPKVYKTQNNTWSYRYEYNLLDSDNASQTAEYVFSAAVDMILAINASRKKIKWSNHEEYTIQLAHKEVCVYSKADRKSKVVATVPEGTTELKSEYFVDGINNDGLYWNVRCYQGNSLASILGGISGYIHQDDIKLPE